MTAAVGSLATLELVWTAFDFPTSLPTGALQPPAGRPLSRPIEIRFHSDGTLYVLDFGSYEMQDRGGGMSASRSGSLWRMHV